MPRFNAAPQSPSGERNSPSGKFLRSGNLLTPRSIGAARIGPAKPSICHGLPQAGPRGLAFTLQSLAEPPSQKTSVRELCPIERLPDFRLRWKRFAVEQGTRIVDAQAPGRLLPIGLLQVLKARGHGRGTPPHTVSIAGDQVHVVCLDQTAAQSL